MRDVIVTCGNAVALLVEALRYKPEGRRFDSWWGRLNSERCNSNVWERSGTVG